MLAVVGACIDGTVHVQPSAHTHTAVASDLTLLIARVSLQHAIVVDMKRRGARGSEAQDPERREMHRGRRGAGCAVSAYNVKYPT